MSWDDARYVSFDVESSGRLPEFALQPHRVTAGDSWLTSFVFTNKADGWKTRGYAAQVANDPVTREVLAQCLDAAVEKSQTVVGWNIAFDIAWLIAYGFSEQVFKLKWLDGMLLWRHLEIEPEYDTDRGKKRSFSLKEAVRQEFPAHGGYEEDVDFHDMSPEMIATRHTYNKKDTIFSFALTKKYYNRLESQNPQGLRAALLEARCLPLVADAWVRGIEVDVPHTQTLVGSLDEAADKALEELAPHGVTQKIVRSPKQLSKLLFEDWGLPVVKQNTSKKTGNTSNSTDKEVLHELSFIDPRAKTLRQYREALNNQTKFPVALLKSVEYNGDGKTRPNARVFGTYTGRMTYDSKQGRNKDERQTGFALHQMKRGSDFRNEIKAPEGYQICEFDAAGQEFRWMAIATGDETMLQLCLPGEDPHGYMGAQIVGVDYRELVARVASGDKNAKDSRQLGKVANLSCIAAGQKVLTDRGYIPIEDVTISDMVWDGCEWVSHDGCVFMGVKDVIYYQGLTATPDHLVLVAGEWVHFADAARHGWKIESPLGEGWSCCTRAAIRIVGGIVRRAVQSVWGVVRHVPVRVWSREGSESSVLGDRSIHSVQKVRNDCTTPPEREVGCRHAGQEDASEASQCDEAAMHKFQRSVVQKLWWAWRRVQVLICKGWGRVSPYSVSVTDVSRLGHRSDRREWSLRARKSSVRHSQGERGQQATYDILNAGTRTRFSVGACIVHNCQYRTSAKRLRSVARVQYNLPMELPEAQRIRNTYLSTYKGVPEYWERQINECFHTKYVETFAGRRVQLRGQDLNSWQVQSTTINYRIQGTGADQKYLALAVLQPYMVKHGIFFAWELHDGLYLYIPDAKIERCVSEIKSILANLPYERAWGFSPPIPLPWDAKVGKRWGDLKEWHN